MVKSPPTLKYLPRQLINPSNISVLYLHLNAIHFCGIKFQCAQVIKVFRNSIQVSPPLALILSGLSLFIGPRELLIVISWGRKSLDPPQIFFSDLNIVLKKKKKWLKLNLAIFFLIYSRYQIALEN